MIDDKKLIQRMNIMLVLCFVNLAILLLLVAMSLTVEIGPR